MFVEFLWRDLNVKSTLGGNTGWAGEKNTNEQSRHDLKNDPRALYIQTNDTFKDGRHAVTSSAVNHDASPLLLTSIKVKL